MSPMSRCWQTPTMSVTDVDSLVYSSTVLTTPLTGSWLRLSLVAWSPADWLNGEFFLISLAASGPMWARGNSPSYPFTSPPSTLSFSICYFSLFYSLHLFSCFSIRSHSTRIVSLCFHVGCRRRRLNLTLFFGLFCVLCIFSCLFILFHFWVAAEQKGGQGWG